MNRMHVNHGVTGLLFIWKGFWVQCDSEHLLPQVFSWVWKPETEKERGRLKERVGVRLFVALSPRASGGWGESIDIQLWVDHLALPSDEQTMWPWRVRGGALWITWRFCVSVCSCTSVHNFQNIVQTCFKKLVKRVKVSFLDLNLQDKQKRRGKSVWAGEKKREV